jgi:solute carrier family 25 citrate transporter 1
MFQLSSELANAALSTVMLPPPSSPTCCFMYCVQINCGSIAPITASQFGTNRFMEKLLMQRSGGELGTWGRFGCAAVAGTVSALVASPTELIIIQQVGVRG